MTAPAAERPSPQEVDVWWGGYSLRALLPTFALGLLLTATSIGVAAFLYNAVGLTGSLPRWLTYHFNVVVWASLLSYSLYRLAGYQYRLTTRRLFCFHGVLFAVPSPVDLASVRAVEVLQSGWQRRLGVGAVLVYVTDQPVPVRLDGVRHPEIVATDIEACIRHRRSGTHHSGIRTGAGTAENV